MKHPQSPTKTDIPEPRLPRVLDQLRDSLYVHHYSLHMAQSNVAPHEFDTPAVPILSSGGIAAVRLAYG